MINEEMRKFLEEECPDAVIFDNPSFDGSIIGISTEDNLIYDYFLMVEELMEDDGISYEEAVDFIDYNTLRVLPYINEGNKPIIKLSLEEYF